MSDGRVGEGGKEIFIELGGDGGEGWLNSLSDKSGHCDNGQGDHQMLKFCGGTFMGFRNQSNLFLASYIQVQP